MEWRLAEALKQLRVEVNAKWPQRSKDSDGSIGDASHASRSSDHNPWIEDPPGPHVVSAIDITHDPAHGFDSYSFAEWLRTHKDPRVKYVISNRRIFSSETSPWEWRKYAGTNPHDHHVHISVKSDKGHYDSKAGWGIASVDLPIAPPAQQPKPVPATVKLNDTGPLVTEMQTLLGCKPTGIYLINSETEFALKLYQIRNGLTPDGKCGPQTWGKLKGATV